MRGGGVDAFVIRTVMQEIPDMKLAVTTWNGIREMWPTRLSTPRVRVDATMDGPALVASLTGS